MRRSGIALDPRTSSPPRSQPPVCSQLQVPARPLVECAEGTMSSGTLPSGKSSQVLTPTSTLPSMSSGPCASHQGSCRHTCATGVPHYRLGQLLPSSFSGFSRCMLASCSTICFNRGFRTPVLSPTSPGAGLVVVVRVLYFSQIRRI